MLPKLNSAHGSETRNIINRAIEVLNQQGKTIQDLVAEGQLTEGQYAELISVINQHVKSGDIDKFDLTPQLRSEIYKIIEIESNLSSGININDFDEPTRQAFLEAQGIDVNYVLGPRNIGSINLKEDTITPETVDFINKSTNLFNEKTQIVEWVIDGVTGEWIEFDNTNTSELIRVKPNTTYSTLAFNAVIYFDDSGEYDRKLWIGPGADTFETRENTHFVRVQYQRSISYTPQLNEGPELLDYEKYKLKMPDVEVDSIKENAVGRTELKEKAVDLHHLDFVEFHENINLINKDNVSVNKALTHASQGELEDNLSNSVTEFISVEPNTDYIVDVANSTRVAYYDINKKWIRYDTSDVTPYNFTTPDNAHWIRTNIYQTKAEKPILNKGTEIQPYTEFKEPYLKGVTIKKDVKDSTEKNYKINPSQLSFYLNQTEYLNEPITENLGDLTPGDWHDLYDDLVARFPDYVEMTVLGEDGHGNEIRRYDFIPTEVPTTDNKIPQILINTGSHGYERIPIWVAYRMFKHICEDWKDHEVLEVLRWQVHFVIVPVVTPSSLIDYTRTNRNGVDIIRNFPHAFDHAPDDPESSTYGGPSVLSEKEAQYVYDVFKSEDDWAYVVDYHNFFTNNDPNRMIWVGGTTQFTVNLGQYHLRQMGAKLRKDYEWMPQDNVPIGFVNRSPVGIHYCANQETGVNSSLYETIQTIAIEPNSERYNEASRRLGVNSFTNWLYLMLLNAKDD